MSFFSFFFLVLSINTPSDSTMKAISVNKFHKKIVQINKVLEKKDTLLIHDKHCIEIIKITNTVTYYRRTDLIAKNEKLKSDITKYENLMSDDKFGRELSDFIDNRGDVEVAAGMGVYYRRFQLYSGGRNNTHPASRYTLK